MMIGFKNELNVLNVLTICTESLNVLVQPHFLLNIFGKSLYINTVLHASL